MKRQSVLNLEEIEVGWLVGDSERVRQEARITLIDGRTDGEVAQKPC